MQSLGSVASGQKFAALIKAALKEDNPLGKNDMQFDQKSRKRVQDACGAPGNCIASAAPRLLV
jgi:hypothetical protein